MVLYQIYWFAVPVILLAALYAFRWKAGLWGNCVTLGVLQFSILIAIGWWEDVAELLAQQAPVTLFFADGIAIWTIFLLSLAILDTATRFISTVQVKYNGIVEMVGNGIVIFCLFSTLYWFHIFANEHLGMVGAPADASLLRDSANDPTIRMFRALSLQGNVYGNLAPFTQGYQFDDKDEVLELHLKRKQAIMLTMLGEDGQLQGTEEQVDQMKRKGRD